MHEGPSRNRLVDGRAGEAALVEDLGPLTAGGVLAQDQRVRVLAVRRRGRERRSEVPLLLLAAAFVVAYAWPILDPRLDGTLAATLEVVLWTVWVAFTIDFLIRLTLADQRRRYVAQHWYDVALIALPMLRPLRLLRLLAFARILNRTAARGLAGRVTTYVIGTAIAGCALGALAVLDAERDHPDADITTFGDALWWSTTTAPPSVTATAFP